MLLMSLVFAEDVIEPVEHGHINWTHSRLVIEAGGGQNTGAWTDTKLVEQTARSAHPASGQGGVETGDGE